MRYLTVFCFACFLAAATFAQNGATLSGSVVQDGIAVERAIVTLSLKSGPDVGFTVQTDAGGNYIFKNIPRGIYLIRAQSGSVMQAGGEVDLSGGGEHIVNLSLRPSVPSVRESVTISADLTQPSDEVSKSVNVIFGQEMRDRADFTLIDTLRTIPGFRVQQLGGFGRTASIKTRGLRNQDTAVLLDGVRFRDAASITGDATPFLSDFTLTSVSRIEVLRGSGSSLYGTNAIGGTIDFQTPSPGPGFHGQISGAAGGLGLGRFRANLSDGTADSKFGFNVGVSRTAYTKGIDGRDNAHNTNFHSKVNFRPSSWTSLSARFFVSDAFVRLNTNPDTFGAIPASNFGIIDAKAGVNFTPDADDPDDFQSSKFFNGQVVLNHIFRPELALYAYYSGLRTSRKNETGPLGAGLFQSSSTSLFDGLIQTAAARIDWSPNLANKVTAGYEFEHERFGNDGRTPDGFANFFTRADQSSNTFFVQDLLSLMDRRLNLAGGFRVQQFNLGIPKFSALNAPYAESRFDSPPNAYTFDASASYFFEPTGTKLRVHFGNGYRVPSLFERFGTFFNTFTFPDPPRFEALGDPNLKPEKSLAFDGGVDQILFGDRARLTAVYFYAKLIDTIGFGNSAPNVGPTPRPFGGYVNQKGGLARGAEFSAAVKPAAATDIFASYTYSNSDQREPQIAGSAGIESLGIPKHQFTAVVTQRFRRFWASFDLLATSSYLAPIFDTNAFTFETYVYRFSGNRRADLTAGYTFQFRQDKLNLRLFSTVENLFDNEYYENGFRTAGRNGRLGLSFGF